jgi:putative heme-binding domain-containing protein
MQQAKIVVPGDPYRSVMMYRMSKLGYARMPYIGSQVIDGRGVTLIDEWIRSLPHAAEMKLSDPLQSGTAQSLALVSLAAGSANADARSAAMQTIVGNTEGALALMSKLHDGKFKSDDRVAAVETVRNASSDIRGLFDDFIPESQRKKTLGRTFEPSVVLDQDGDALRGRLIFFSDAARCRACHHTDDAALSVGPTLKEISKKYLHESEMLQHILQPSLKVDEKFAAWAVVTIDGKILTGLLEKQTDTEVVLRAADRQLVTVAKKDIEEMQKSARSLMPDGVLADLTAAEAADLLAYVKSLSEPAK